MSRQRTGAVRPRLGRIDRSRLSPFLEEEWRERKGARIFFYTRLSAFCCDHLPEVRLADEGGADRGGAPTG